MEYTLSESQQQALDLILEGKSVFITGSAGHGKSFLINKIRELLPEAITTASSGVAALNINGITIHSFLGLGIGEYTPLQSLGKIPFEKKVFIKNKLKTLIIDEISMISCELLDKINGVLQLINRNKLFMGGVQLIVSGDLLQLGCISDSPIYKSELLKNLRVLELKTNFRHNTGNEWKNLLLRLRIGEHTQDDIQVLMSRVINKKDIDPDIFAIFPTNSKVNNINNKIFDDISGDIKTFKASYKGDKNLLYDIKKQFKSKDMDILQLKVHSRVMLIRNVSVEQGLVNGSTGVITSFNGKGLPIVLFDNGIKITIEKMKWEREVGLSTCNASQIPLNIAFAGTIHKTQGCTLETAVIDLAGCFCNHQVYVALSRVKTLEGVILLSFDPNKILVDQQIVDYYKTI
jgi:ATP-dependent DNA helicase PIF1